MLNVTSVIETWTPPLLRNRFVDFLIRAFCAVGDSSPPSAMALFPSIQVVPLVSLRLHLAGSRSLEEHIC